VEELLCYCELALLIVFAIGRKLIGLSKVARILVCLSCWLQRLCRRQDGCV